MAAVVQKEAPVPHQIVDRDVFFQNLRTSKLLTSQQLRVVVDKLGNMHDTREIAKALATWKLLTKFQAKMLLVGRTSGFFIGPYRILEQLGHGGMGRVYKAVHQTMNRTVALKVLAPQVVRSERAHQLFLHEVQAAAQLSHPNIVMAYDANEANGRHYLAMEYVDGPNLEKYVRKHGSLPEGLACEVVFQAANGLQHAFEKGMVHRDIKPANLLLHHDAVSGTIQVKILDFGLARLNHTDPDGNAKTLMVKQNSVMGTPDFLSPEQSRNLHDVDIRADLYSLGCTFYYLLTGEVPFPGGTTVDKLVRHNREEAKPIEVLRPDLPNAITAIVRKLMAKKADDRYQTPDELMDVLAPHAAPSVIDWPIGPPPEPTERSSQEHPVLPDEVEAEPQVDTEPRAQGATQVSDADSILDWVDLQARQRRRFRRTILLLMTAVLGMMTLAGAALAALMLNVE